MASHQNLRERAGLAASSKGYCSLLLISSQEIPSSRLIWFPHASQFECRQLLGACVSGSRARNDPDGGASAATQSNHATGARQNRIHTVRTDRSRITAAHKRPIDHETVWFQCGYHLFDPSVSERATESFGKMHAPQAVENTLTRCATFNSPLLYFSCICQ